MGKNKIALIIIVFIIAFSVLLFFLPVNRLIGRLPYISEFYNNTTLEISTKRGLARVWIDGQEYGQTPTTVQNLPEGTYIVELEKIDDSDSFYERQTIQVELTRNTSARIDLEIGPDNILHGIILYYTPIRTSSQDGFLTIISDVSDARVFLDGDFLKVSPVTNLSLKENQYDVKVVAEGYEEVEIPVLVRNNYSLNLKTFHFPIPVVFEDLGGEEIVREESETPQENDTETAEDLEIVNDEIEEEGEDE